MMTPMDTIIGVVRDRLADSETTGNLYECGPNGVNIRTSGDIQYADDKTEELCILLEKRALGSFDVSKE
jgi:hypothetical protein